MIQKAVAWGLVLSRTMSGNIALRLSAVWLSAAVGVLHMFKREKYVYCIRFLIVRLRSINTNGGLLYIKQDLTAAMTESLQLC